jgi:DNA-binding SARP family transcriptional activator
MGMVAFRLLGPVVVEFEGQQIDLGRRQERCLLGVLALEAGKVVSIDRLISLFWDEPPRSARAMLHTNVARLRRRLVPYQVEIVTKGAGYLLHADATQVDAMVFGEMLTRAHAEPDLAERIVILSEALALWRGPLMSDALTDQLRDRLTAGLEEARLRACELLGEAQLATGRYDELIAALPALISAHPTRERLAALLMQARHRTGDIAGALGAYDNVRRRLADELGVDVSPKLASLHRAVLNRQEPSRLPAARKPAPASTPIPRQLPPDIGVFAGRKSELRALDLLFTTAKPTTIVISAITGTAGIGKSTLAVHWAHSISNRFPDGILHVNLRGFDPGGPATSAEDALRGFLDALDVPAAQIPASLQAMSGLYRSLVAQRRILVLLDNAKDADQVRPLLPGSPACLVVVTSRQQLSGLVATHGAQPLTLGLLTPSESRQLLEGRLGKARVVAEPQAVDDIISLCAGLPLALAIVAARAAIQPQFPLSQVAAELNVYHSPLDALASDDKVSDVRSVFSWSYHALGEAPARLFRLLGLHPGPAITLPAAASLAGWSQVQTRASLAALERAHLITQRVPGRYTFHDLLRAYAADLAASHDAHDNQFAVRRMLDHYLHTAHMADLLLDPHRDPIALAAPQPGSARAELSSHDEALDWFTAEHSVLMSLAGLAGDAGHDAHVWQLAWTMANYLERQGHWRQWLSTQSAAVAATDRLGEREANARCHRTLARAYARLGDHDLAHTHLQHTLTICDTLGDQVGQAYAHLNINVIFEGQFRYREALRHAEAALDLYRRADHVAGQALALNAIGWSHAQLGDCQRALDYCEEALDLQHTIGDRAAQADTWDSLGYAHRHLGNHELATSAHGSALRLFQELGDRYNEATTLAHIGDIADVSGLPTDAHASWTAALTILNELGHPDANAVGARIAVVR